MMMTMEEQASSSPAASVGYDKAGLPNKMISAFMNDGQVSTVDSLSLASLPSLALGGSCNPTWESLPAFSAGTMDSLPSFDECDQRQFNGIEDHYVDFKHWGGAAFRRFGYDFTSFVGRFGVVGPPMTRTTSSTSCVLRHGSRKSDGGSVLIKSLSSPNGKVPKADRQALFNEFCLLRALRHEAIVSAEVLLETKFDSWLVLDALGNSLLQTYVDSNGAFSELAATSLFAQLLQGLAHIHSFGVAHSGLSPSNVILDEGAVSIKIADFGNARISSSVYPAARGEDESPVCPPLGQQARQTVQDPAYQAPEQVFHRKWNERADIWAAGLILHFKLMTRLPFDIQDEIAAELLKVGVLPCPLAEFGGLLGRIPTAALPTLRQCLIVPMQMRPSAFDLLRLTAKDKTIKSA
mmetsp:Transcript_52581/g.151600  ORF Transcript_52581/g.151600 Transcript_52581/m.151600 type:complete len:408 (-) Transcript_52581:192-1415(-)|eukprot:CAMPEP_0176072700 /NCGR_PEP_ID=MMETSP0120_2-20121206/36321_1 /TAXON_ID=160619 /ORGANISM="Kryptoperidinium foliaceum, Strain CCMP 1326" /LENGTH=407 /DNA_ID=CAMNT_0017406375 /DNA_START=57 /DNA_END=1280 /DNA_ORIENTATION=-